MAVKHEFIGNRAGFWCYYQYPDGNQCGLGRAHPFHFVGSKPVTPPKPVESPQEMHTDLCGRCGKDASHELCPMRDCESKDTPCVHCGAPVYYSFGYKVYAHEGHRPSLKHRLPTGGDWGKWADCQNPDGSNMGTTAEPKPAPQTCEHGVLTADHCKTCDPAPRTEGFWEWYTDGGEDKHRYGAEGLARSTWSAAQAPLLQKIAELERDYAELNHGYDLRVEDIAHEMDLKEKAEARIAELESALAQKKWIDANQEKPRTGRLCLVVWSGVVQHTPYSRQGIGFACEDGYEWRAPEEHEVDTMPDEEVELWMYMPEPPQPNADDEEMDK